MWELREKVSLLLSHGHANALSYPIAKVWAEADILAKFLNRQMATSALLNQMAVSSVYSKEAGKLFGDMIKKLDKE